MDFKLNEYQRMLQQVVRKFSADKIAPAADERYVSERLDRETYDELGALGLPGICFPAAFSGADDKYSSFILAVEELAKVDDNLSAALSASVLLCQWSINRYGTESQKQKYLKPLVEGWQLGAFGLTEGRRGSDIAELETVAVRQGDHYLINGSKSFITNGGEAETYVVFAITDKNKGSKGVSAFILTKGLQGFSFSSAKRLPGCGVALTRDLIFRDARVPVENLLGKEGQGLKIALSALEAGQLSVTAQIVGIGQTVFDKAMQYVKEKMQFRQSVAENQKVLLLLASMEAKLNAARLITYQAAYVRDMNSGYRKEAAIAQNYALAMAVAVITGFLQIAGRYALRLDCSVRRLMRKAQITRIDAIENRLKSNHLAGGMRR